MTLLITHNASSFYRLIIKLFVSLLYLPSPYRLEDENLLSMSLNNIWDVAQKQPHFYELMAPLIIGSRDGINWLTEKDADKLDKMMVNLI